MGFSFAVAVAAAAYAPAPACRHVRGGRSGAIVCQQLPKNLGDGGMKDINKAGPSDDRQKQIDQLMTKLRQRGQVGDSSELGNSESFLSRPPPPPPPPPPPEIVVKAPAMLDEANATEAGDTEEVPMKTSGIGGTWTGKEASKVTKYEPKVSTWGVFDRPADISKAYGGGRQIGVGGYVPDEEEMAKKRRETEERLKEYRKGQGADLELQAAHEDDIREALKEAKQLMRFGATKAAIEQLNGVKEWCCVSTDLGSDTLLELSMALIANKQDALATPVLMRIQMKAPTPARKRVAQQLMFQEKAQNFLKVEGDPNEEFAKLGRAGLQRSLGVDYDKRYDTAAAYLTSSNRPPVASLSEARMVLRSAAVRRDDGGAPQRIAQAIGLVVNLPQEERLPSAMVAGALVGAASSGAATTGSGGSGSGGSGGSGGSTELAAAALRMLRGEWLLGMTISGRATFAPSDAALTLQPGGAFDSLAPSTIGLVKSTGTYELGGGSTPGELRLRLEVETCRLGPLPLPGKSSAQRVVFVDTLMFVTQPEEGGEYSVYVRPSMSRPAEDE